MKTLCSVFIVITVVFLCLDCLILTAETIRSFFMTTDHSEIVKWRANVAFNGVQLMWWRWLAKEPEGSR